MMKGEKSETPPARLCLIDSRKRNSWTRQRVSGTSYSAFEIIVGILLQDRNWICPSFVLDSHRFLC